MAKISYVLTYFNNPDMMKVHLATWHTYTHELRQKINFIVVDDHSNPPLKIDTAYLNLTVLRVKDDIKWNLPGARNLGAKYVTTDWFLMTDTDMLLTAENAERLLLLSRKDPMTVWNLKHYDPIIGRMGSNANQFFIARSLYWKCWGYEEDFSGSYGGQEGHLRSKIFREGGVRTLDHNVSLVNFGEEGKLVIPDAKSSLDEYKTEEGLARARKISERLYNNTPGEDVMKKKIWNQNVIRFKWEVAQEFKLATA